MKKLRKENATNQSINLNNQNNQTDIQNLINQVKDFGSLGEDVGYLKYKIISVNNEINDAETELKTVNVSETEQKYLQGIIQKYNASVSELNQTLITEQVEYNEQQASIISEVNIIDNKNLNLNQDLDKCKVNLNATQTLADQNGQYAIANQTLWQDSEQNYTDLDSKYQMTTQQLIKFKSLFNQTEEDLSQCGVNLNDTQALLNQYKDYATGNKTLADKYNDDLKSANETISGLNNYLQGNQTDFKNQVKSLTKNLTEEQAIVKHDKHIIHKYRTEYNITGSSSKPISGNDDFLRGALVGGVGTFVAFAIGALLHYKFSNKKPLFQQTIDELVDTEVLALIKFMDKKMEDDDVAIKENIIRIFDKNFQIQNSNNAQKEFTDKWGKLSKSFLGYGPESETRYSAAYRMLFDNAKALNSINEEGGGVAYDLKPENTITFNKVLEQTTDLDRFNNKEVIPGKVQQAVKLKSIIEKFK